jgi:hypothetical protein
MGQRLLAALPQVRRPADEPGAAEPASGPAGDPAGPAPDAAGGRGQRLRDQLLRPANPNQPRRKPDPGDSMSPAELAAAIKRVDDREKIIALYVGVLGVAFGIFITILAIHLNPAVGQKNHANPSVIAWEGGARVLLALLVIGAAFTRRRSLIGFALLFLGTAMGSPLFALPFWAVGGWMIWRVFKWQKLLTAKGGDPNRRGARAGTTRAGATRPGASNAPAGARAARSSATRPERPALGRRGRKPEPAGPAANKRYTPPKPAPRPRSSSR